MTVIEQLRGIGRDAIARGSQEASPLPWDSRGTIFPCAWEYPVRDLEVEVGFFLHTLGFTTIALDDEYALFATPERDLTFACRRHALHAGTGYPGHILCLMTRDIESSAASLERWVGPDAIMRLKGSPVQTVLQIDIWEFPN